MPEYPPACWWDEWPEPRVPLGEAQMKYASKPVPEGAKFRNAPLLAAGIGILRVCHLLSDPDARIKSRVQQISREIRQRETDHGDHHTCLQGGQVAPVDRKHHQTT